MVVPLLVFVLKIVYMSEIVRLTWFLCYLLPTSMVTDSVALQKVPYTP